MGRKIRVCFRCRDLLEDAYILTPCTLEEFKETGRTPKDRCEQCRKRGLSLICYDIVPKRRGDA